MKVILNIAPSIKVKGGISSAIKGFLSTDLAVDHKIILVSSHVDGIRFKKFLRGIFGLIITFFCLMFRKIDVVHIHGSDIVSCKRKYFYYRLARAFKVKIIYHCHGAFFVDQYAHVSRKWKNWIRELLEECDLVICLSKSWKNAIQQIAPLARIDVVPNSVKIPNAISQQKYDEKNIQLTFLGLIGQRKGIFDLLIVTKRLVEEGYNVHVNIAGNGEIQKLRDQIAFLHLNDKVDYLGWIGENDKELLYMKTDIFVLPSYGEGMPMSILEAMSYHIPVISTWVGGIPEVVVDEKTGFLVKPGDLQSLVLSIRDLVLDGEKRRQFGNLGRLVIEAKHNLEKNIKKIDEIYNTI